jgi:hypothetical protein
METLSEVTKGNKIPARTAFSCTLEFSHQTPIKPLFISVFRRFGHPNRVATLTGFELGASPVWRFDPPTGRADSEDFCPCHASKTRSTCIGGSRTLVVNSIHVDFDPSFSTAFRRTKQDKNIAETATNCACRRNCSITRIAFVYAFLSGLYL